MLILGGPDSGGRTALYALYSCNPYLPDADAARHLGCSVRTVPVYRRQLETAGVLAPRARHQGRWRSVARRAPGRYLLLPRAVLGRLLAGGVRWGDALRTWGVLVQRRITSGPAAECALTTAELADELQIGVGTVQRALRQLVDCGLLHIRSKPGRRYRLLRPLLALPNTQPIGSRARAAAAKRFELAGFPYPDDAPPRRTTRPDPPAKTVGTPPAKTVGGRHDISAGQGPPTRVHARESFYLGEVPSSEPADEPPRGPMPQWLIEQRREEAARRAVYVESSPAASTVPT